MSHPFGIILPAIAGLLLAAGIGLWLRLGPGVFVEMLAAGWTACFG